MMPITQRESKTTEMVLTNFPQQPKPPVVESHLMFASLSKLLVALFNTRRCRLDVCLYAVCSAAQSHDRLNDKQMSSLAHWISQSASVLTNILKINQK